MRRDDGLIHVERDDADVERAEVRDQSKFVAGGRRDAPTGSCSDDSLRDFSENIKQLKWGRPGLRVTYMIILIDLDTQINIFYFHRALSWEWCRSGGQLPCRDGGVFAAHVERRARVECGRSP